MMNEKIKDIYLVYLMTRHARPGYAHNTEHALAALTYIYTNSRYLVTVERAIQAKHFIMGHQV